MNEFLNLVKEIANELEGWTYKPRDNDYSPHLEQIDGPDGATVAVMSRRTFHGFDRETARLEVYGQYPSFHGKWRHHRESEPRITVAARRAVSTIARNIKQRLLPAYLSLYVEDVAWVQQKAEAYDEGTASLTAIAEVLGVPAPINDSRRVTLSRYREEGTFGSFEATNGDFHVSLHGLSLEKVLAIARLFRE